MTEHRNTRDELRIFARCHPDLSVDCFDCEGTGRKWLESRWVECWRCMGFGTVPHVPKTVRAFLELAEGE